MEQFMLPLAAHPGFDFNYIHDYDIIIIICIQPW